LSPPSSEQLRLRHVGWPQPEQEVDEDASLSSSRQMAVTASDFSFPVTSESVSRSLIGWSFADGRLQCNRETVLSVVVIAGIFSL